MKLKTIIKKFLNKKTEDIKMENKDYYYEVPIAKASQVKDAYEYAVKNNKKYYRGVSRSGKYYAIDKSGNLINLSEIGKEWMENDKYISLVATNMPEIESEDNDIESEEEEIEIASDGFTEEDTGNDETAYTKAAEDTVDYKSLYEDAISELDKKNAQYEELESKYNELYRTVENVRAFFRG